jgi:iron(III) transport system ATP-binding protein
MKLFGATRAVDDVSFEVAPGKIVALLGPSGCGKTTTLRCIAGLEKPDGGEILVDGEPVTSVPRKIMLPPERRHLGMVFQSYAIWPHMSVAQNVGYPLSVRRRPAAEIRARVGEALELVGLGGLEERPATKLSGGQQQRVALARAIVARPRVLLFDEPLSNLDAKLRGRMRFEIARLQRDVGISSVYVTHDQAEAMAIADELIVMNNGRIEQRADARTLYERPASAFVADFIGAASFFDGVVAAAAGGDEFATLRLPKSPVTLRGRMLGEGRVGQPYAAMVRPEAIELGRGSTAGDVNRVPAEVLGVQYLGDHLEVRASALGAEVRFRLPPRARLAEGDRVELVFAVADCLIIPSAGPAAG